MQLKKCCSFLGIALFGENKRERKTLLQSISFSRLASVGQIQSISFSQLASVD